MGVLLKRLETEGRGEELAELQEALDDRDSFTAPVITKFLNQEYGLSISSLAVQRHRRTTGSGCQCPKTSTGESS